VGGFRMPGVTKHIYDHDIRDILTMWNRQLKEISLILPQEYTKKDIISLMKKYYPHEWMSVVYKYNYYESKDRYLKKRFGKKRYNMPKPEKLIESVLQYRKLMK
jgi:polysaccharide pyruvyl transferase WcaK-like protein